MMTGRINEDVHLIGQLLARDNLPRLTHFSYNSINEHSPTPRMVQRLLSLHHKDKLEYFACAIARHMEWATDEFEKPPWGTDEYG